MKALIAAGLLALLVAPVTAQDHGVLGPTISGTEIQHGVMPNIRVEHLNAGERIRVHTIRMFSVWESEDGEIWQPVAKPLHAWADFRVDAAGRVDLSRMSPLAGSYSGIDPYGVLWSGRPIGSPIADPFMPRDFDPGALAEGQTVLLVSVDGVTVGQESISFVAPGGLRTIELAEGRLNGVYSAPSDGVRHPALILLHGSEGGDRAMARNMAERFAGQGYAAFAFNYFAWDLAGITGIPNAHVNQPVEMLTAVRDWLAQQPEADVERLGVYGHSKGAEFAEVAAVRLPWIDAVAACVPTDAVWQGYGIGDGRNSSNPFGNPPELYSSFSWEGAPLPYIPLNGDRSPYHSNTGFYEAKRAEIGEAAVAAEIAVEQANAAFLWIGGGRDEVWASGPMARHLDARMRAAGEADRSELHVYERAGHAICGDGTYPTRLWQNDSSDPRDPDLDANGRATVDAWSRITAFFARTLKSS